MKSVCIKRRTSTQKSAPIVLKYAFHHHRHRPLLKEVSSLNSHAPVYKFIVAKTVVGRICCYCMCKFVLQRAELHTPYVHVYVNLSDFLHRSWDDPPKRLSLVRGSMELVMDKPICFAL